MLPAQVENAEMPQSIMPKSPRKLALDIEPLVKLLAHQLFAPFPPQTIAAWRSASSFRTTIIGLPATTERGSRFTSILGPSPTT